MNLRIVLRFLTIFNLKNIHVFLNRLIKRLISHLLYRRTYTFKFMISIRVKKSAVFVKNIFHHSFAKSNLSIINEKMCHVKFFLKKRERLAWKC